MCRVQGSRFRVQVSGFRVQGAGFTARVVLLSCSEREFVIDNLLVQIHFINEMIWWTGLAPWEFEFPFAGSLILTFLVRLLNMGALLRESGKARDGERQR